MTSLPDNGHGSAAAAASAASWFARLNADKVTINDLQAFQAWRRDVANDQAYRRVETLYARGQLLDGDPDIARALSAALGHRTRRSRPRVLQIGLPVAATLLFAVSFGLWAASEGRFSERVYQTAVGGEQDVHLPDGSVVRLDTDSRLAARFSTSERRVALLRGRAFFAVAHDVHRPFIVLAGDTKVRAVGTRFSVQRDPTDIQVVLVQGVVAVSSGPPFVGPKPTWTLKAGQELTLGGKPSAPAAVDVALATSWLQNQLSFRNLPLKDAIVEVNRYAPHKLVLDAPEAGDIPVSGVFDTGDPLAFATAAADVCGLKVIAQADGSLLLRSKQSQPQS